MDLFSYDLPQYKITKPIRLIELFAGVGSQAKALSNLGAGFEHYRVVEFDKYAVASYNAIHGTNFETSDITQITGADLGIVDTDKWEYIMTYSFPCQDLSIAGKGAGMGRDSGTRSGLLWEVERLLNEVEELPQVLLMENVPQVISQANIADFHEWQKFLENKGYSNYVDTLNAKNYGVAQNRNRTFMVSILGQWNYNFPKHIPLTKTMKDYFEDEVDEKYYIKSEKAQKLIQQLVDGGQLKDKINCVDGSINEPKIKRVSNCIKARYDAGISNLKSDGGMVVECKVIGQMDNTIDHTFESANRVYDKEGLSPTINTCGGGGLQPSEGICNTLTSVQKDNLVLEPKLVGGLGEKDWGKQWRQGNRVYDADAIAMALNASPVGNAGGNSHLYKTDYRIRKLTPKECWRLMGFTDTDFEKAEKVNSNSQLYKQAGNSIVVDVLEQIFKQMLYGGNTMQNKIQALIKELQVECESIAQEYKREINSDYTLLLTRYTLGEYSGLKYAIRKLCEIVEE